MDQLETLVAADSANDQIIVQNVPEPMAVPPLAPAPAQAPILTTAPTPVTQPLAAPTPIDTATAASIVKDLRIGEHTDKTRLVLDMTAEVPYKATLNADGMGVVLILPNTAWSTDQSWSSNVSPMVKSYKATPAPNGGTRLDIAFTEKASLKYNSYIKPRNGMSRLVIDLFSSELHLAQ